MLSSVLRSKKAIQVNISIIRVFTRLRRVILDTANLSLEIQEIKKKIKTNDKNIDLILQFLDRLTSKKTVTSRKKIGYLKD